MNNVYISSETTYVADQSDTTYIIAAGSTVSDDAGIGINAINNVTNRNFVINGKLEGLDRGLQIGDVGAGSMPAKVTIGASGYIVAESQGIFAIGDGHQITNFGTIASMDSYGEGIAVLGDNNKIVNHGLVVSAGTGIWVGGDDNRVTNNGHVSGQYGVIFQSGAGEHNTLVNNGSISVSEKKFFGSNGEAIYGGQGDERIVNKGTINGNVNLGDGNDIFISKHGQVNGEIRGELGDDTYVVDNAALKLVEYPGQGFDTVRTSVSWTLGDNFEMGVLTGKKNINLFGNGDDNFLYGNKAKNKIFGEAGEDFISGGKGNDKLWGGAGADEFSFVHAGGKNAIMDFEAGVDHIDISAFDGIKSFSDLLNHHVSVVGDDIVITAGDDILVLKQTALADLDAGTFTL